MCFKNSSGEKLLTNRCFKFASGNRYININQDKTIDRILKIDLVNNKGTFNIKLINISTNEIKSLEQVETNTYCFDIIKNNKYRLLIELKGSVGSYKVTIK